jgi:hypothetical protein
MPSSPEGGSGRPLASSSVFCFRSPRALRLIVKLPKLLADRFGVLGFWGNKRRDRDGGDVDALFPKAFKKTECRDHGAAAPIGAAIGVDNVELLANWSLYQDCTPILPTDCQGEDKARPALTTQRFRQFPGILKRCEQPTTRNIIGEFGQGRT